MLGDEQEEKTDKVPDKNFPERLLKALLQYKFRLYVENIPKKIVNPKKFGMKY